MNEDYVAAAKRCARNFGFNFLEVVEVWEEALKHHPDMQIDELVDVTAECASVRDWAGEDADHENKVRRN